MEPSLEPGSPVSLKVVCITSGAWLNTHKPGNWVYLKREVSVCWLPLPVEREAGGAKGFSYLWSDKDRGFRQQICPDSALQAGPG